MRFTGRDNGADIWHCDKCNKDKYVTQGSTAPICNCKRK